MTFARGTTVRVGTAPPHAPEVTGRVGTVRASRTQGDGVHYLVAIGHRLIDLEAGQVELEPDDGGGFGSLDPSHPNYGPEGQP